MFKYTINHSVLRYGSLVCSSHHFKPPKFNKNEILKEVKRIINNINKQDEELLTLNISMIE